MVDQAVMMGHEVSMGRQSAIWGDMPMKQRLAILGIFCQAFGPVDDLIAADMADTGRSNWQAKHLMAREQQSCSNNSQRQRQRWKTVACSFQASLVFKECGTHPPAQGRYRSNLSMERAIADGSMKVAPALVMGNAAILKPSEETPRLRQFWQKSSQVQISPTALFLWFMVLVRDQLAVF